MPNLSEIERRKLEDLFGMSSGYVLNFSDKSFSSFFRQDVGIDIYSERFSTLGTSKAKRLRQFLEIESRQNVGKALDELLKVWRYEKSEQTDPRLERLYGECCQVAARLLGKNAGKDDPEAFLRNDFGHVSFEGLNLMPQLIPILEARLSEMNKCEGSNMPLASIFLCGSILEGILLSIAVDNPKDFNSSPAAPRGRDNVVKNFQEWSLASLIDVSHEVGLLREDARRFSHALRDFRNYIHPHAQMASRFSPDILTARLCSQALRVAIIGIRENKGRPPIIAE
jgi:hypothetical protein